VCSAFRVARPVARIWFGPYALDALEMVPLRDDNLVGVLVQDPTRVDGPLEANLNIVVTQEAHDVPHPPDRFPGVVLEPRTTPFIAVSIDDAGWAVDAAQTDRLTAENC
jgi:hypothetical protein